MQQSNKNNASRNNRLNSIRSNLKVLPIFHSTTDRIQQLINQQRGTQHKPKIQISDCESIEQEQNIRIKSISQNRKDFQAKFRIGKKLGQGTQGYVKQCFHKQTEKMFALKTIPSDNQFFYHLKRNFINILQLDHPNVMKYKAFYFDTVTSTCLLVMQYLPFPNLNQIQIENQEELKQIIYQIISGLQYIHHKHICHRDIKPQNILYDKQNKRPILIDFGCSRQFYERGTPRQMLTSTGTPVYRAPQMFTGGGYNQSIDIWAVGVLIYKLIEKVTPFQSEYHCDTINNILKGQFVFNNDKWSKYSHLVKDLVTHLLKPKQSRLTIREAKQHFWFQVIRQQIQSEMIKSAGFQSFFVLKRTATQCKNNSSVRPSHPTLSPILTPYSPKMFNLQKYQDQQKKMRWLNLDCDQQLDLIQSQDQDSILSPSPKLPIHPNKK